MKLNKTKILKLKKLYGYTYQDIADMVNKKIKPDPPAQRGTIHDWIKYARPGAAEPLSKIFRMEPADLLKFNGQNKRRRS